MTTLAKNSGQNLSQSTETSTSILNAAGVGGPFTMNDHNGNGISEKNLTGHYTILFFGFTYCPAICPTELQKLTRIYSKLPKPLQNKLQLYFVTVDPERDTQEVLKNYVGLFDDKWVGLRGNAEQTEAMKNAYKIYSAKVLLGKDGGKNGDKDDYTIDHSSFIYLMGKDGKLLRVFKSSDPPDSISEALKNLT